MKRVIHFVFLFFFISTTLYSQSFYVSPTGKDSNAVNWGKDTSTAFATITFALSKRDTTTLLPLVINVMPGNYNQYVQVYVSGTAAYPITIQANKNALTKPVFWGNDPTKFDSSTIAVFRWTNKSDYITLDSLIIQTANANNILRGFWMNGDHMTIKNCEVHTVIGSGIFVQGNYNLIDHNLVDSIKGYYLNSSTYLAGNNIDVESYYYNNVRRNSEYNTIQFNTLKNNPTHFGVNIFPDTGDTLTSMHGNRILYNFIDGTGGGIYTRFQYDMDIIGNVIVNNKLTSPWISLTQGGGIFFDKKDVQVTLYGTNVRIYNNTIANNQVYGILNNTSNNLNIKNNIISNNGNYHIRYDHLTIDGTSHIDNNLYYGSSAKWYWGSDETTFSAWQSACSGDGNGISGKNPNFIDTLSHNFKIPYGSSAKNAGQGLLNDGVLIDNDSNPRPYWNKDYDIGAYEVQGDAQLKIGLAATPTQPITFKLSSLGIYWERNSGGAFLISQQSSYSTSTYTDSVADANTNNWRGWDLGWLSIPNDSNKQFAHGIYKFSNNSDSTKYFYIDYRDAITAYSPDIYIQYNNSGSTPHFEYYDGLHFQPILNGSIIGIWTLNNSGTSNTAGLNNYWAHALVYASDTIGHAEVIWGPNSAPSYFIYRYFKDSPQTVYCANANTFSWIDTTVYVNYNQLKDGTHYYVSPVNISNNTDTVLIKTSNSETWSGNIYMVRQVDVPYGKTLTINPGTAIYFAANTSLIDSGRITISGSQNNQVIMQRLGTTGNWGTISISGSGAKNSKIQYARILYANEIDVINADSVSIQNCNIDSSLFHGINFSGGIGCSATNDTIKNSNSSHGIYIQNGAGVTCIANAVKKTTYNHTGVGIYFGGGGYGIAKQNDITGFSWGLAASWGSSLSTPNSGLRNNRVANSNYGLMVYNSSFATLGMIAQNDTFANNSIQGLLYNAYTYNTGSYQSGITAYHNYWGSPIITSKFYTGTGSYLYYNNYLTTDPWAGIAPLISVKSPENISTYNLGMKKNGKLNPPTGENVNNSISISSDMDSLIIGIALRDNNQNREAKDFFLSYLKLHPDNQAAYIYLFGCADDNTTPEISRFFSSLPSKASAEQKLLLSYLYLRQGNVDLAKKVNSKIATDNLNTPLGVRAKLNNFYIALYTENDVVTATSLLNEVKSQANLSTDMEISSAEDALTVYGSVINANSRVALNKQGNHVKEQPTLYYLSQNYPNPFNPSTTIMYSIKDPGLVKIELFDILGRRVKTLVNEEKQSGEYKVNFTGNNLASGVYIYRLTSGTFTQVKKMQLLK
jgi:hypothetical protein